VRSILLGEGYTALLRARRRKEKGWDESTREKYKRHRWQVEGAHGRAKTQHGLHRAKGRGLANVSIQVYLTAAVMNLKKLVTHHPIKDGTINALKCLTTRLDSLWRHWQKIRVRIEKINETIYPQLQLCS